MEQSRSRRCLWVSALASILLILVSAFQWSLVELVTPFLLYPILLMAWILLLSCFAWAVISFVRNRKRLGWSAASPALVCAIGITFVVFVPFTDLWLKVNFKLLRSARAQIVRQVQDGVLRPNMEHNSALIALGRDAPTVSMGGNEIIVERHDGEAYVFFFTCRGILDNYSGFLFVPTGGDPKLFSDLNEDESTQLELLEENWYFAAHW